MSLLVNHSDTNTANRHSNLRCYTNDHKNAARIMSSRLLLHLCGARCSASSFVLRFGDEYISRPSKVDLVTGTRIDEHPFVKFTFRYRSMGMVI